MSEWRELQEFNAGAAGHDKEKNAVRLIFFQVADSLSTLPLGSSQIDGNKRATELLLPCTDNPWINLPIREPTRRSVPVPRWSRPCISPPCTRCPIWTPWT